MQEDGRFAVVSVSILCLRSYSSHLHSGSQTAAAISIGVLGITTATLEVGVAFGAFEASPLASPSVIGWRTTHLGHATRWLGGVILMVTGLYTMVQTQRAPARTTGSQSTHRGRLLLTSLALSFDNLAIGFALGTRHISLVLAAIVVGAISVAMSLVGLELGSAGRQFGQRGEFLGGALLVGVGIAIASGAPST